MIDKPALARNMFEQLKTAGAAPDDAVRRMEFVALLLDSAFVLPGTTGAWASMRLSVWSPSSVTW